MDPDTKADCHHGTEFSWSHFLRRGQAPSGDQGRAHQARWTVGARRPAKHLMAACERSCRALDVARIDLYQLHTPDSRTPLATSIRALAAFKRNGLVAVDRALQRHGRPIEEAETNYRDRLRSRSKPASGTTRYFSAASPTTASRTS